MCINIYIFLMHINTHIHVYISEKYYVYILYVFKYNIFSKYSVYLYTHILCTQKLAILIVWQHNFLKQSLHANYDFFVIVKYELDVCGWVSHALKQESTCSPQNCLMSLSFQGPDWLSIHRAFIMKGLRTVSVQGWLRARLRLRRWVSAGTAPAHAASETLSASAWLCCTAGLPGTPWRSRRQIPAWWDYWTRWCSARWTERASPCSPHWRWQNTILSNSRTSNWPVEHKTSRHRDLCISDISIDVWFVMIGLYLKGCQKI